MTVATNSLTNALGTGTPDFPNGMPTVAGDPIVESGSNTDGSWTRWADGTQRVSVAVSFTWSASAVATTSKTMPAAFIDNGYYGAFVSIGGISSLTAKFTLNTISATTYEVTAVLDSSASDTRTARGTLFGRWK